MSVAHRGGTRWADGGVSLPGERVSSTILALESNTPRVATHTNFLASVLLLFVAHDDTSSTTAASVGALTSFEAAACCAASAAGACDTSAMDGLPVAEYPTVRTRRRRGRHHRSSAQVARADLLPFLMFANFDVLDLRSPAVPFRLKNSADFALMDPVAPAETPLRMLPRS